MWKIARTLLIPVLLRNEFTNLVFGLVKETFNREFMRKLIGYEFALVMMICELAVDVLPLL